MFCLVCFDISCDRSRYRVVKILKGHGIRVQKSVFECQNLTEKKFLHLQAKLAAYINHCEDSVRYYRLCGNCLKLVEWTGAGSAPETQSFISL